MTDVVVPGVGTLKFPDSMSQEAMAAAIQKNFPQIHGPQAQSRLVSTFNTSPLPVSNIGPAESPSTNQQMYQQTAADAAQGDQQIPLVQRESFHEKSIPVLGGMAGMLVPGAGWGALGLQSLFSGAGSTIGELFRQKQIREPIEPQKAIAQGAKVGAANFAGGAIVKGVGALARKIFSSPLSEPQQAAAQFAREEGAPFPLSSAAPESGAGRTQQASRVLLPGEIKTKMDADKVAQFINNRVGTLTEQANVFDDAARNGQEFLRQVFEPGETIYKTTFQKYAETVGDDVAIPATNTLAAVQEAADKLANRGQTTGGLYQRLRTILKRNPQSFTPRELDELYGGIISQAFTSKAKAGGEGQLILGAIARDMDEFGKPFGANFSEDIAKASAVREQFRELRKIPQLERLAAEIGSGRDSTRGTIDWMNTLFSSGNGKALAKLRELNPDLYHDLADAWLAKQVDGFAKFDSVTMGRTLDGAKFRSWFMQNEPKLREIYGAPQAKALDNFSLYAELMSGAVKRSGAPSAFSQSPVTTLARGGAEIAGSLGLKAAGYGIPGGPLLMLPSEGASFVLARGLSDPSSSLFRVFTQGFSPGTRAFMVKSAELSGQAAARGKDQR